MPSCTDFRDRALGLLLSFGPVTARAMFGGYGLYLDGVMFGLIAHDTLYFKVDEGKRRPFEMSYYQVPEAFMDNPTSLAKWAERAHQAAKRTRAKNPPRRKRSNAHPTPRRRS